MDLTIPNFLVLPSTICLEKYSVITVINTDRAPLYWPAALSMKWRFQPVWWHPWNQIFDSAKLQQNELCNSDKKKKKENWTARQSQNKGTKKKIQSFVFSDSWEAWSIWEQRKTTQFTGGFKASNHMIMWPFFRTPTCIQAKLTEQIRT